MQYFSLSSTRHLCNSLDFLEVIIDAFEEAGLIIKKDAQQKLKVWYMTF